MKNKINNKIKKDFDGCYGKKINLRVLKISDLYLMKKKMSLHMKISGICLMNLHLNP